MPGAPRPQATTRLGAGGPRAGVREPRRCALGTARARTEGRSGVAAWGGEACVHGDECVGVGGVSSASCTRGQRACGRQHPAWGGRRLGLPAEPGWRWVAGGGDTPLAIPKPNTSTCVHGAREILFPQQHWRWLVEFRDWPLPTVMKGNGKIGVKNHKFRGILLPKPCCAFRDPSPSPG